MVENNNRDVLRSLGNGHGHFVLNEVTAVVAVSESRVRKSIFALCFILTWSYYLRFTLIKLITRLEQKSHIMYGPVQDYF